MQVFIYRMWIAITLISFLAIIWVGLYIYRNRSSSVRILYQCKLVNVGKVYSHHTNMDNDGMSRGSLVLHVTTWNEKWGSGDCYVNCIDMLWCTWKLCFSVVLGSSFSFSECWFLSAFKFCTHGKTCLLKSMLSACSCIVYVCYRIGNFA